MIFAETRKIKANRYYEKNYTNKWPFNYYVIILEGEGLANDDI